MSVEPNAFITTISDTLVDTHRHPQQSLRINFEIAIQWTTKPIAFIVHVHGICGVAAAPRLGLLYIAEHLKEQNGHSK